MEKVYLESGVNFGLGYYKKNSYLVGMIKDSVFLVDDIFFETDSGNETDYFKISKAYEKLKDEINVYNLKIIDFKIIDDELNLNLDLIEVLDSIKE
ncbi:MAG: hypothetical protein ACRCZ0_08945 [Cetobacterium sp.]